MNDNQFELLKSLYENTFGGCHSIRLGLYEYLVRPSGIDRGIYNLIKYSDLNHLERLGFIIRDTHAITLTESGIQAFYNEL